MLNKLFGKALRPGKRASDKGAKSRRPVFSGPAQLFVEHLERRDVPGVLLVTNGNNDGPGSLRQAILDSNQVVPEWDEIRIAPDVAVIDLTSALPTIGGHVDINGPEGSSATIRRFTSEPFRILTMAPNGIIVTLRRLRITGGQAVDGGGIYAMAELIMEDCIVELNTATGNGGGIFHTLAPLYLRRTFVGQNTAGLSGGGIFSVGQGDLQTLTLHESLVGGNTAGIHGGGIYYDAHGIVNIIDSDVSENTATNGNGGGVHCANCAELNVYNTKPSPAGFYYNFAANGIGGGIYVGCVSLVLYVDTTVLGNFAGDAGTWGLYAAVWPNTIVYIGPGMMDSHRIEDC